MTGAEATILVIFMLWAIVIVCFIVGSLADRKRRRAVQARLDRQAAEAAARRRAEAPYHWPKHRGPRQEFGPLPATLPAHLQPRTRSSVIEDTARAHGVIIPAVMSWPDPAPSWDTSPSCDTSSSVSASCD